MLHGPPKPPARLPDALAGLPQRDLEQAPPTRMSRALHGRTWDIMGNTGRSMVDYGKSPVSIGFFEIIRKRVNKGTNKEQWLLSRFKSGEK
jgi:hypothetical protein